MGTTIHLGLLFRVSFFQDSTAVYTVSFFKQRNGELFLFLGRGEVFVKRIEKFEQKLRVVQFRNPIAGLCSCVRNFHGHAVKHFFHALHRLYEQSFVAYGCDLLAAVIHKVLAHHGLEPHVVQEHEAFFQTVEKSLRGRHFTFSFAASKCFRAIVSP